MAPFSGRLLVCALAVLPAVGAVSLRAQQRRPDLDVTTRGLGTPLELAERLGQTDVVDALRRAGARGSGHSVGERVCVRPWAGDGYCGVVEAVDATRVRVRIDALVGCERGCDAHATCSAGLAVGGRGGLRDGDRVETETWCLTDTDVPAGEPSRRGVPAPRAGAGLAGPRVARSGFDMNGIVHVSWWDDEYAAADAGPARAALADTGANWAAVLVTWYQDTERSSVIAPRLDDRKTPNDTVVQQAIADLRGRGLRVMLKPHVDPWNGRWRGDIIPDDVDAWFGSYTRFIVRYAQMAEASGAEGLVVGTELRRLSGAAYRDRWLRVIDAVRREYHGLLTYAANATSPADEFTGVSFWDRVDLLGLDAYFSLTDRSDPSVDDLVAAWSSNRFRENSLGAVQTFAASRQQPVIFTELGYRSVDRANVEPWNFTATGAVDLAEQRDCYEAAFRVWSGQASWMRGIFWWAWPVPPPGAADADYTPRGKPAEAVLRTWQGAVPAADFTLSARPALTLRPGHDAVVTIHIARMALPGAVAFEVRGVPPGVSARFDPASTTDAVSHLTLTAAGDAALGASRLTVTATAAGLTRTAAIDLTVSRQAPRRHPL